jgi:hypothetical protein
VITVVSHLRGRCRPNHSRSPYVRFEALEARSLLNGSWGSYAGNPQHTALSAVPSQSLDQIAWQTPVDLDPQYSGSDLLIHYGSPLVTPADTVIVPVKTGATNGFEVRAFSGPTGTAEWTLTTDYILPPHDWTPSYSPVLTPGGRLYFAGAGGTVYYTDSPDSPTATTGGQLAFYGISNYTHAGFDGSVYISTPITSDANGDIFFGFQVTGSNPLNLQSGIARIGANGTGTWVSATAASGDSGLVEVPQNCAPALSNDGSTLYIAVSSGNFGRGDLLALNSTTLATVGEVALKDPATGNNALITDDSTASPTVGSDGDVYYGVLENPFASNHDRGWLLHFSGNLTQTKIPGAFGWDDTASIVPASMVPSYKGTSSYLLMTKYNNYAEYGGAGQNKIAILDPNAMAADPVTGAGVMQEVETILGPTPDPQFDQTYPGAVREWCINTAVVDPATDSVLANSEDGTLYRWDLANNTFSQKIVLTTGQGEAYTPTVIGADGTVYAINNAVLYAVQASTNPTHIVDDSGTGFATTGTWTSVAGSGYGGESQTALAGTGSTTATWSFVVAPGTYRVSATWTTDPSRATNAPFNVYQGGNLVGSFAVDEQDAPSTFIDAGAAWQDLGGPVTVTGNTLVVTLSNNANGTVDADAIRIERLATGQPFAVGGASTVNPDQFRVTTFATGLNYPVGMIQLSDGSILVATSPPVSGSSSYYDSTGQLIRLVDANGDGVADGPGTVLASGLPGSLDGLAQAGPYVITTSASPNTTIVFLHTGATPASPLTVAGSIDLAYPSPWEHMSYALATRPTPGQPGSYDVLFNVGSQYNGITTDSGGHIVPQPTTGTVTASGLISGTLNGDSIYMVTLQDNNGTPVLSNLRQVATGLRNAASMAFDPATGDLLLADNGIDGIPDPNEAYSADTLQRIAAANIGVVVPNFGYPYTYTLTTTTPGGTGTRVNPSGGVTPLAAFEPLVDPLLPTTGSESEGASGFAPSPLDFPVGLQHGVFIGFHGIFNAAGTSNEENPLLYADPSTGNYFDFISNDLPNIGHFDGAMATADSLFLSDMTSSGSVNSPPGQGVIYQIKAVPTYSIWSNSAAPQNADTGGGGPVELGVKFTPAVSGTITGVRFYKGPLNTGTHIADLWTSSGTLLATATFSNETASGWQQVNFAQPVAVTAGTTYVASYHTNVDEYAGDANYFASPYTSGPLQVPAGGGVYGYGPAGSFPSKVYQDYNYWVDVVLSTSTGPPPSVTGEAPAAGATGVAISSTVAATFNEAVIPSTIQFTLTGPGNAAVPATLTYDASTDTATLTPWSNLIASTTYTATVSGAQGTSGGVMAGPVSWTFTTAATYGPGPFSIWNPPATPQNADTGGGGAVELGVQFTPAVSGTITGVRFYKGPLNTGTHVADLWTSSGTLLATATFSNETASGWQEADFSSPVAVTAGTTYVASYHTNVDEYAGDANYFAAAYTSGPLQVPAGGGVYAYGPAGSFPNKVYQDYNYWVDVVLSTSSPASVAKAAISALENPSGQQVASHQPTAATAGTTYVASYRTDVGEPSSASRATRRRPGREAHVAHAHARSRAARPAQRPGGRAAPDSPSR